MIKKFPINTEFQLYLIDKEWVRNFKKLYNYDIIKNFLDTNMYLILQNNYASFNINSQNLFSNKNFKDIIEPIKFSETISLINSKLGINIEYCSNYEIIDSDTFQLFEQIFLINAERLTTKYKINFVENNRLIINYSDKKIEIIQLDDKNKLKEKYLIEAKTVNSMEKIIENLKNNINACNEILNISNNKCIKENTNGVTVYNILSIIEQYSEYNNVTELSNNNQNHYNIVNNNIINENIIINNNNSLLKININEPCLIGLNNIGATCYMNASLQCLSNVTKLTKYILSKNFDKTKKLTFAYQEVLSNLWLKNKDYYPSYSPYHFKNIISEMNPLFQGIQANDSKDLVQFIIMTLHEELNNPKLITNNNISNQNMSINSNNYQQAFNNYISNFSENYKSIISDIFYGTECSIIKCALCNNTIYNIQCFNMMFFPLEQVRIFKNYNNNQNVNIFDCFQQKQSIEYLNGQNQIFCNNCCQMSDAYNQTVLVCGPNVLIINLNRGKGLEFNVNIDISNEFDISGFLYNNDGKIKQVYELIGVVCHLGLSGMSGHFIAFCRSEFDGNWYKYNDSMVSVSDFLEAATFGTPYLLFYKTKKL